MSKTRMERLAVALHLPAALAHHLVHGLGCIPYIEQLMGEE